MRPVPTAAEVARKRLVAAAVLAVRRKSLGGAIGWIAFQDRGEDRAVGMQSAERLDLLADPERTGRMRRAEDGAGGLRPSPCGYR